MAADGRRRTANQRARSGRGAVRGRAGLAALGARLGAPRGCCHVRSVRRPRWGGDGGKQSAITALPTPPSANRGPASSEGGLSKELPVPPGGRNAGAGVAGTRAGERFEGRTRLRPGRGDERGLGEGSGGSRPALGTLGWVAGEDGRVGG